MSRTHLVPVGVSVLSKTRSASVWQRAIRRGKKNVGTHHANLSTRTYVPPTRLRGLAETLTSACPAEAPKNNLRRLPAQAQLLELRRRRSMGAAMLYGPTSASSGRTS